LTFTGRFLDSQATQDFQQPFKTARAESIVVSPSLHRIYMQIGSAVFAYSLDTFFTRVSSAEPLMSVNQIPTTSNFAPHPSPVDMVLGYDAFFYAENEPANGWTVYISDGQRRLQGFDIDDQGYVYLAYSVFGWGIVKDDLSSNKQLMQSMHQHLLGSNTDDVVPYLIAVMKTSDNRYFAVISGGNNPANLYEVTDRTNPVHHPSFNKYIVAYAKTANLDRIAFVDGANIQIYSSDAFVTGGGPILKYSPIGQGIELAKMRGPDFDRG